MTIQKTCKQLKILDRMRRVLCYSIVFKNLFRNIVIHENLQSLEKNKEKINC